MADNRDTFPVFKPYIPAHFLTDKVLVGDSNIVADSAINVLINGRDNYVGDFCKDINMYNCSGCVVEPYTSGVIMLNSSGVVTNESNVFYIKNNLVTNSGDVLIDILVVSNNYTATVNDSIIVIGYPTVTVTIPNYAAVGAKQWIVKNMSGGTAYITTTASSGFDGEASTITLNNTDSYTLKAYSTYILIL
jgi:hypothetical protein